jgi:glutathione peroxidase
MSIYEYSVKKSSGETLSLEEFRGKVLLIVNTASKCGFTPQYEELQKIYEELGNEKFEILAFPCNQFGNQEPGSNDEVVNFCSLNYGVTFSIMEKVDVNGENAHPVYKFLKDEVNGLINKSVKWNFTKFLVDKDGKVVERFSPTTKPFKIKGKIQNLIDSKEKVV